MSRKWREATGYGTLLDVEMGYVRVSKREQKPEMQRRESSAARCERIHSREESRPQLEAVFDYCHERDVLVVWRLDRLERSIKDLKGRGRDSASCGSLWTPPRPGQLVFYVFASIARFERNVIRERMMAGLEAARARGIERRAQADDG